MSRQASPEIETRRRRNGVVLHDRARPQVNGAQGPQTRQRPKPGRTSRLVDLPAFHSEEARKAVLQSGSGRQADRMSIDFHSPDVDFELSVRGKTLLSGALDTELTIDGESVLPRGDWRAACWHSDADGDYLELQLCVNEMVRIDRQLLLSRRGRFAFMADVVIAPQAERIEYRLSLPAAEGTQMKFDASTREARLRAPGCVTRVFPLALPQDRVLSTAGSCLEQCGRLELRQVVAERGLFAPLIFDWHPRRRSAAAEWRSLTVTELGKAVGADRAVGHRLRLGKQQLLIYRSLSDTDEPRAVLGQHTRYETLLGLFDTKGDVTPIMMVEKS